MNFPKFYRKGIFKTIEALEKINTLKVLEKQKKRQERLWDFKAIYVSPKKGKILVDNYRIRQNTCAPSVIPSGQDSILMIVANCLTHKTNGAIPLNQIKYSMRKL